MVLGLYFENLQFKPWWSMYTVLQVDLGLGLGLQGLYSAPQTVRITF